MGPRSPRPMLSSPHRQFPKQYTNQQSISSPGSVSTRSAWSTELDDELESSAPFATVASLDLQEAVERSPLLYSQSHSPRFRESGRTNPRSRNFGRLELDTDTGGKKTIAHAMAVSPRSVSSMRSTVPRFAEAGSPARERQDRNNLDYYVRPGFAQEALSSTRAYKTTLKSPLPRFNEKPIGQDAIIAKAMETIEYDIDTGTKMALFTALRRSQRQQRVTPKKRFKDTPPDRFPIPPKSAYLDHIGPGSYTGRRAFVSGEQRAPSAVILAGTRAPRKQGHVKYLGTGPDPARASLAWSSGGFYSSRTAKTGFVPPKVQQQTYNTDQGSTPTVGTAVKSSKRNYATCFRPGEPREIPLAKFRDNIPGGGVPKFACSEEIGPGRYKPKVTFAGQLAEFSQAGAMTGGGAKGGSSAFNSPVPRFLQVGHH
jgi:hypothetical protein